MAIVTFTIPDNKMQYFIDYFGQDYQSKVDSGEIDGGVVNQASYAKDQAFQLLAGQVRKWHKQESAKAIVEVDITV